MNPSHCEFENELLDAMGRGFVGAELESHLAACVSCSELRLVAGALLDERLQAVMEAPVPSAGTMWWRMQMRHRQEIQATARRSLLFGQFVTLAFALVLVFLLLGGEVALGMREAVVSAATSFRLSTPWLLALGSWLLLAPIAGYVAIRQK